MKKFLLLIVCVICLVFGSCGIDKIKEDESGINYIDLKEGEELISASYCYGYYNILTHTADSTYIPQEKKLRFFDVGTGVDVTLIIREH